MEIMPKNRTKPQNFCTYPVTKRKIAEIPTGVGHWSGCRSYILEVVLTSANPGLLIGLIVAGYRRLLLQEVDIVGVPPAGNEVFKLLQSLLPSLLVWMDMVVIAKPCLAY